MNSRKNLKKIINKTMEVIYIDYFLYMDTPNADINAANDLLKKANLKHSELISRISVKEGKEVKGRTKSFYKKLISDFVECVNTFNKEIEALP